MAAKTFIVTVPSGFPGGYYIDGVQRATLGLAKGATFRFDVSDATNGSHPFKFSLTSDGTHGGGSEYTTGVTSSGSPGTPGAYVEISLTSSSPDTLYYYCSVHPGMGSQLNVTADSFGALGWNLNSWGNQDENFINLSGFSLSTQLGTVLGFPSVGYGGQVWGNGEWGELGSPEVIPTGISLSADLGTPSITAEVNVGWSAKTWGYGNWTTLADTTAEPSGNSLTANQGQVVYTPLSGWDAYAWGQGNWGEIPNSDITLTGISLNVDVGTTEQFSSSGWGRSTWGSASWNSYGNAVPTGIQATFNIGSVTIAGEINSGYGGGYWGQTGWGAYGTAYISNGIEMSANIGSVSINNEINIGWGSDTWGYETWGTSGLIVVPTGIEATFTIGTLGIAANANTGELTGETMTMAQGNAEGFASFVEEVSGFSLPMQLNFQEVVINATGFEMTMQEGDEVATPNTIAEVSAESAVTWGNSAWGYGVYGNQQVTTLAMSMQEGDLDPAPDVALTGNAAAMFLGDETVTGDANTGTITNINWGEQAWGDSTWGNGTFLSGASYSQAATISLGTAVGDANTIASITGQLMTMQEGDEGTTANSRVTPTGINLTFSVGTVYNLIWNEVNTGTTSTWTEVDTAA